MIERFTIDTVADEIERQFKGAEPQKKLLRRFFREGKRHGKKGLSSDPMQSLLENAVEVATSKIAEDFLDEEKAAEAQLAGMRARQAMLEEDAEEASGHAEPGVAADTAAEASGTGGPKTAGPDLNAALGRLRAEKAAKAAAAREAAAKAAQAQAEQRLDDLEERIAVMEQELEDLPEKYQQLVESCHETGELMWSRYRTGYLLGMSRRGLVDDEDDGADDEIEFDYPDVLDPDESASDDDHLPAHLGKVAHNDLDGGD